MHAAQASQKSPEAMREWDTATVAQLILFPCLPYLLWAVLYYIKAGGAISEAIAVHGMTPNDCLPHLLWAVPMALRCNTGSDSRIVGEEEISPCCRLLEHHS